MNELMYGEEGENVVTGDGREKHADITARRRRPAAVVMHCYSAAKVRVTAASAGKHGTGEWANALHTTLD